MDVKTGSPDGFCYDTASTSPTVAYRAKYYSELPESRKMNNRVVAVSTKNNKASFGHRHIAAISAQYCMPSDKSELEAES
jgi:hypothetical protein